MAAKESLMVEKRKEEGGRKISRSASPSSPVLGGRRCSGRNRPAKNLRFFGLVEIAALAAAEFKSRNIIWTSKKNSKERGKHCNAKPVELPKPDCWRYVRPSIGGVDFHVFLFDRKLTKTDVNPSEARLFMNKKEIEDVLVRALSRREEELVFDPKKGLEVQVIDRLGNRYMTCLKFWQAVRQFALFKEWKKLVEKNQLVEGDVIRVWFFRYGDDLKLAFLIIPLEEDRA